jgi:hypothetical protein
MYRLIALATTAALGLAFAPVADIGADIGAETIIAVDGTAPPTGDAVIAMIDTGINPYHEVFRDDSDRAYEHPSTYIDGFPEDAPALELTFNADSYEEALAADCALWQSVKRGELYWFPGTKIIGGISFNYAAVTCGEQGLAGETHILDNGGHGTMVASRAAAANTADWGACPSCRLVAIEYTGSVDLLGPGGSEDAPVEAISFAADHRDWIDVQSNSWGPIVPVYDPTSAGGLLGSNPGFIRAVERVSAAQPAFWASGNGAAFRGGVAGHPTFLNPSATPSAIMVGGHDSGYVNVWPGFPPHLVSDSCDAWAANAGSYDAVGDDVGGGTSGATPFVAGNAAELIAQARGLLGDTSTGQTADDVFATGDAGAITEGPLADGVLDRDEWQRLLYTTASDRPERQYEDGPPCGAFGAPYNELPILWADVPDGYPEYVNIGYGAVDTEAMSRAGQVLLGELPIPDRTSTDRYFELHEAVGGQTHTAYTMP